MCVRGKLHWVVQHIKQTKLHHLTMWPNRFLYCGGGLSLQYMTTADTNICKGGSMSAGVHATQQEKIEAIVIFQCLQEQVIPLPLAVSEILHGV